MEPCKRHIKIYREKELLSESPLFIWDCARCGSSETLENKPKDLEDIITCHEQFLAHIQNTKSTSKDGD